MNYWKFFKEHNRNIWKKIYLFVTNCHLKTATKRTDLTSDFVLSDYKGICSKLL